MARRSYVFDMANAKGKKETRKTTPAKRPPKPKAARKKTTRKRSKAKVKKIVVTGPIDFSKELENKAHEAFCQQYYSSQIGSTSYKVAYPHATTLNSESGACRLLRDAKVSGRLGYLRSQLSAACKVNAERLLSEWAKIGFSNIRNIIGRDNVIKDISTLPEDIAAAVESISVSRTANGKNIKVVMHSKPAALENMGRMLGVYDKDNAQRTGLSLADICALMGVINEPDA